MDVVKAPVPWHRSRRLHVLGLCAIGLAALMVLAWWLNSRAPAVDGDRLWIGEVTRGELLREVTAMGSLVATELRAVTNQSEGVVERIRVLPGDLVEADDVLLEMSSPQLNEELAAARWDLEAAEADEILQRVEAENGHLDLVAQHASALSEYTGARIELDAREALRDKHVFSAIEIERSELRVTQLRSRLDAEKARLDRYGEFRRARIQSATATLSRQRDLVARLQARVDGLHVVAGSRGVVQEINVQEGERLGIGQAVARVVNPSQLIARVRVSEREAAQVAAGQRVHMDVGRETMTGTVRRVDPTVRERVVNVDVDLAPGPLPASFRPELSVTARIELERVDDVVLVSRPSTLRSERETIRVFRLNASRDAAERVDVEIGRVSSRLAEVVTGLKPGDRIVLNDLADVQTQSAIRIR